MVTTMDSVNSSFIGTVDYFNVTERNATEAPLPPDNPNPRCRWPAPTPNWTVAFEEWQWIWHVHIYLFPTVYLCLTICILTWFATGCYSRAGQAGGGQQGNKKTSILNNSLHGLVLVSCSTRCIFLYSDPYGTRKLLPCPLGPVLWSCGWPFITASISVLLLVLLESTKMTLGPPRFQQPSVLGAIIVPSLCFVFVADFLVAYDNSATSALLVCQVMFILWGFLLGVGFLVVARKLRHVVATSKGCFTSQEVRVQETSRLKRLNGIVIACSVVALILTSTNLYAVVSVYISTFRSGYISPWRWMTFQTCQRIFEVSIVVIILLAAQGTSARGKNKVAPPSAVGTQGASVSTSKNTPV